MNRDLLKQIIVDQKDIYLTNPLIPRQYILEENVNYCFVGIRQTGKSYMMYQQIKQLEESGIPLAQILYVNFEDERLLEANVNDLNTILEIGLEMSGTNRKPYLFFDEIQNITGWEKFARRVADMKYIVSITGSNSKMLSSEIASTLGGRFVIMNIYPYSFTEYLSAKGRDKDYSGIISTRDKAEVIVLYEEYVKYGAFPALAAITNKRVYLNSLYQTVYIGDIITRNKITNDFAVKLILKKIAESISKPLSFSRLFNILKSAGTVLGKQTVINYVGYMTDSYLIFPIQNYAAKLVDKETFPKYFFMDTGFLELLLLECRSAQLENLVAIELIRRYGMGNVYYFASNVEIDFYVPSDKLAIQVSMQVLDNVDTKEREIKAFAQLHNYIQDARCILITNSEEGSLQCSGINIEVIPIWRWLLHPKEQILIQ